MKRIIIAAVVIVAIYCVLGIVVFMLLGCSGANGSFDNPIVVVGDTIYINPGCGDEITVNSGNGRVSCFVNLGDEDGFSTHHVYGSWGIQKVVLYFDNCP